MFKNLKSLFIVEEAGPEKTTRPQQAEAQAPSPASTPSRPVEAQTGQVSEKFMDVLLKAMEEANLDGFDYLEFKRSLQSLSQVSMDESTRFQSAFAMAQTLGASSAHLVQTATHYLEVLKKEEEKFAAAVVKQREQNIGSKKAELDKLEASVKAKEAQIQELMAEIDAHRKEAEVLQGEIAQTASRIENTQNDFEASYQFLVSQIQQDVDRMKQYLK